MAGGAVPRTAGGTSPPPRRDANRAHARLRARRTRQCPAQDPAHPAQTALLPRGARGLLAKAIYVLQAREIGG
jgi:hypothetical protein